MTRPLSDEEYAEDERYLRAVERDRVDRERERAPLADRVIELKVGVHVPPDVAERQLRVYRDLLGGSNG